MRAYVQQLLYRIQGSYWFLPSLMVFFAIVLSQAAIALDRHTGSQWIEELWFTSLNQPDGARALLATVAGSMITVAGVTFSLTILAVSHATSHFGPRLLDNFMRDRGNQVTLGTFVATFVYCLLVLRVVRGEGALSEEGFEIGVFVPQLSLLIALLLTLASVGVLIYFIHHVPDSIHISTVLQRLSNDMLAKLDELYPETVGSALERSPDADFPDFNFVHAIRSNASGYLQGIDDTALIQMACKKNAVVKLLCRPGDFICEHQKIAMITSVDDWNQASEDQLRFSFTVGFTRTPTQDAFFTLNEFVEVATRALSPGVNDPFTAMQCIDWLSVGLVKLSNRNLPPAFRTDNDGNVRVITTVAKFDHFVDSMLGQLVPYVQQDKNAMAYFIRSMNKVLAISDNDELNGLINEQLETLRTP